MAIPAGNSFDTRDKLNVGAQSFDIHRLEKLEKHGINTLAKLPFSLRILLENLLRCEDGRFVHAEDIRALATWTPNNAQKEIAFMPARVLLQDFTGVPAVVDLATMREAVKRMGGNPARINPLFPAELVIDHSVQVDKFGDANAFGLNAELEFQRNVERYAFLRWGQTAFKNFKVVPPDTGICHQVNLEYLARVVCSVPSGNRMEAYPDSVVGTDSHTTMVNALGVFGWGVGGIEAEAAMLGQPSSMLIPEVVGFRLHGKLREGATATDLVLTVTEMLRKKGVVGKFVEFYGTGLSTLSVPDRATIANMAPEYGATMGFFPVDSETLAYLQFTGRAHEQIALVEASAPIPPPIQFSATNSSSISAPSSPPSPDPSAHKIASRCAMQNPLSPKSSKACRRNMCKSATTVTLSISRAARSSSPQSQAAPIRRTHRSCWVPACSQKKPWNAACKSNRG